MAVPGEGSVGGASRAAGALARLHLSVAVLPCGACSVSAALSGPPARLAPSCDPPLLSPQVTAGCHGGPGREAAGVGSAVPDCPQRGRARGEHPRQEQARDGGRGRPDGQCCRLAKSCWTLMRVPQVSQQRDNLFPLEATRFGSFQPVQRSLYRLCSSQGCGAELELQEGALRAFRRGQTCTAVYQQSHVPLLERHPRTDNAFEDSLFEKKSTRLERTWCWWKQPQSRPVNGQ
jgi:hypothetical protein